MRDAKVSGVCVQVYSYTARGLYEGDKLLFTLLLALKTDLQARNISHSEFHCFIKGSPLPRPLPAFLWSPGHLVPPPPPPVCQPTTH